MDRIQQTRRNVIEQTRRNVTPQMRYSEQLIAAAKANNNEDVQKWLPLADTSYADHEALRGALRNKNAENVQAILNATDRAHRSQVILHFRRTYNIPTDIIKVFTQYLNHSLPDSPIERETAKQQNDRLVNYMAQQAIKYNNTASLQHLLTQCDPKSSDSLLLQVAAREGHDEMINLLYSLSDPEKTVQAMHDDPPSPKTSLGIERINERRKQEKLHQKLTGIVDGVGETVSRKM